MGTSMVVCFSFSSGLCRLSSPNGFSALHPPAYKRLDYSRQFGNSSTIPAQPISCPARQATQSSLLPYFETGFFLLPEPPLTDLHSWQKKCPERHPASRILAPTNDCNGSLLLLSEGLSWIYPFISSCGADCFRREKEKLNEVIFTAVSLK